MYSSLSHFIVARDFIAVWVQFLPPAGQVIWHPFSLHTCVQAFASQVISLAETWSQLFTDFGHVMLLQFPDREQP